MNIYLSFHMRQLSSYLKHDHTPIQVSCEELKEIVHRFGTTLPRRLPSGIRGFCSCCGEATTTVSEITGYQFCMLCIMKARI